MFHSVRLLSIETEVLDVCKARAKSRSDSVSDWPNTKYASGQAVQLGKRSQVSTPGMWKSQPVANKARGWLYMVHSGECRWWGMDTGERVGSVSTSRV